MRTVLGVPDCLNHTSTPALLLAMIPDGVPESKYVSRRQFTSTCKSPRKVKRSQFQSRGSASQTPTSYTLSFRQLIRETAA